MNENVEYSENCSPETKLKYLKQKVLNFFKHHTEDYGCFEYELKDEDGIDPDTIVISGVLYFKRFEKRVEIKTFRFLLEELDPQSHNASYLNEDGYPVKVEYDDGSDSGTYNNIEDFWADRDFWTNIFFEVILTHQDYQE